MMTIEDIQMICNECETVAHCLKNGCVPKQPSKDEALKLALEALEFQGGYEAFVKVQESAATAIKQALAAPVQDEHQAFIDALPKDGEDKMFMQIDHWARESYKRHQSSVRGHMITAADAYESHVIWATLRWAKENTPPAAQPAPNCTRSHPHENMDAMCELRTEIARLTNENARLKAAAPVQEPVACDGDFPEGFDESSGIPAQALRQANAALCEVTNNRMWDVPALAERMLLFRTYTTQPAAQRPVPEERKSVRSTWVGLTDEEIKAVIAKIDPNEHYLPNSLRQLSLALEAKLKEKNSD